MIVDLDYMRQPIGSFWPRPWPTDGQVVVLRKSGALRPLTDAQKAAIDYLIWTEDATLRGAAERTGLGLSSLHELVQMLGLERVSRWRFPAGIGGTP